MRVISQADHNFISEIQQIIWRRAHFSLEVISFEVDSIVIRNPNVEAKLTKEVVNELKDKITLKFDQNQFDFVFNGTNELNVKILKPKQI